MNLVLSLWDASVTKKKNVDTAFVLSYVLALSPKEVVRQLLVVIKKC